MTTQVSVRLGVDGQADVTAAHKDVGDSGQAAFDGIAASAGKASEATDAAGAAVDRQTQKYQRMAAAAQAAQVASANQSAFNAVLGVNPTSGLGNAQASAQVFIDQQKAEDALTAATAALRAEIDPLGAAQLKLSAATATANELFAAGKITATEQAAALALAQKAFGDAEKAAIALGSGAQFSQVQLQELGAVVHRSIDAIAAGASPVRVLATEGGRLGVAFGSESGGVAGVFKLLSSPIALFIEGGLAAAAVIAGLIATELRYEAEENKLATAIRGTGSASGATVAQLEGYSQSLAKAEDLTSSAARSIVADMASIGTVSAAQIPKASDLVVHFAEFFHQDFSAASTELAKAFSDPAKGAEDLETRLHLLTAAQVENILELQQQGDRAGALNALMNDLNATVSTSSNHLHGLQADAHDLHVEFDGAADAVGNFIRQALGLPSADVAKNLQESLKQYSDDQNNPLASLFGLTDSAKAKVIDAAVDLAAQVKQKSQSTLAVQSQDLKAAFSSLDPQAAEIQQKIGAITQLNNALADSSGKLLAATGLTQQQAQAAVTEGDKEIARLQLRSQLHDKHAETLARESAAMVANAQASMQEAAAYLVSDAAGEKADATRKAITDATKKGIDTEAEARRQLAVNLGDQAVAGAKAVADLDARDQAQKKANASVESGVQTSAQAAQSMQTELALRPLIVAAAAAEGAQKTQLIAIIGRQRTALNALNADQATSRLNASSEAASDRIAQLQVETAMTGDLTGARERLLAVLKLEQSPDYKTSTDDRAKAVAEINALAEAQAQLDEKHAAFVTSTLVDQQKSNDLATLELQLVGATADVHDAEINRLQRIQALKAAGVDLSSADAQKILDQGAALDALQAKLRAANDNWNELKSDGEQFITDVLNPSNWTSWSNVGKTAITDIANDLLKLDAINPLENWLFGESKPTGGSIGSAFSKLFGGSGSSPATTPIDFPEDGAILDGFAVGTDSAPGGPARIDEEGGEIVNLPDGSQVIPADATRKLVAGAANSSGGAIVLNMPITLNAQGAGPNEVQQLAAQVAQMKRELPGTIIATVNDGIQRRSIRAA